MKNARTKKTIILPKGTLFQNGKYRIESFLGQGGFGITYKATQTLSELAFEDYVSVKNLKHQVSEQFNNLINKAIEKKPGKPKRRWCKLVKC